MHENSWKARHVSGYVFHRDQYVVERSFVLISSPHHFALFVGCRDSRVPPEAGKPFLRPAGLPRKASA